MARIELFEVSEPLQLLRVSVRWHRYLCLVACTILAGSPLPLSAQSSGLQSSEPAFQLPVESGNQSLRSRIQEDARASDIATRLDAERRERQSEQSARLDAEREFARKREAMRSQLAVLPENAERRRLLDEFACMYPPSAKLPPAPQALADCVAQARVRTERDEALRSQQQAERERKAAEARKSELEQQAARERAEEERLEQEAKVMLAAALAAQEAGRTWARNTIGSAVVSFLGLLGMGALVLSRRKLGWAALFAATVAGLFAGVGALWATTVLARLTIGASPIVALLGLFDGWGAASQILLHGRPTFIHVLKRGCILAALLCALLAPLALFFPASDAIELVGSGANTLGTFLASNLAFLTSGLLVGVLIACVLGAAIIWFTERQGKTAKQPTKKRCPRCSELVLSVSKRCLFCGAALTGHEEPLATRRVFGRLAP